MVSAGNALDHTAGANDLRVIGWCGEQRSDLRRAEEGCPERLGAYVVGDDLDDLSGLLPERLSFALIGQLSLTGEDVPLDTPRA